ncbi:MAG: LuxR C-terminal-related transcriptional regulator [Aggregatilineales bacterium]
MIRDGSPYVSPKAAALTYMMRRQTSLSLTETDRDVLWLLAEGYNTQKIAAMADLTTRSVYRIREKLRKILNVKTNEQIVDAARKRGLLDISNQA